MDNTQFIRAADRASLAYAAMFLITIIAAAFATDGVVVGARGVIGGDFLAFYTAGEFALRGEAASAYDFQAFDAALKARAPLEHVGMMWQYPPAMFFIVAPFALLPYKISYILWTVAGWSALGFSLRRIGMRGEMLRILLCSSTCVSVLSFGQISMATAGLLFLAAYKPKANWIVAGIAAGLLTIKPQLGLLIPFAFLALGAWRTIAVACATAALLHLPTLLAFGIESWPAFFDAAFRFQVEISGAASMTPPRGMTTLFGQLKLIGVAGDTAMMAQIALTAGLAVMTVFVFRRPVDALAKAAFLGAAAILAAPYAYGYEMTALLLAGVVAARAAATPMSPLGALVIASWILIASRPFFGELSMVNTAFAISAGALATLVGMIFYRPAIDRNPATA